MKKRILTLLLLISPYLYIMIAILYCKYGEYRYEEILDRLLLIYLGFLVVVYIPNMVYAFVLAKHGEKSTVLLFWDMLLKLCNIPIFIVVYIYGFIMAIVPMGIFITVLLIIVDFSLLLPSSMYGVSGLIQARREGKITTATAVVNSILHLFFCADVISAIVMFCVVKARAKSKLNFQMSSRSLKS